jgi:hypothetical protein
MSRWFRLYADAMRNPKIMRLDDSTFRLWVKLLAVASENDGKIPAIGDLKLMLNTRLDHLSSRLDGLIRGGLIDALADGYAPHNWEKFQYKSDTSKERVAKYRAKGNVTVTPPDTDTDTDTDTEKKKDTVAAQPTRLRAADLPEGISAELWVDYRTMRSRKRAPMTAKAESLMLAELNRLIGDGHDPTAVVEQSIANSWTGLFEIKDQRNGNATRLAATGVQQPQYRRDPAWEGLKRLHAELEG